MNESTKEAIEWIINNRVNIPSKYWSKSENEYTIIWLLDREDGTAGSYETSQERLGVTIEGEILWGFSSGCSCWDGWKKEDYDNSVTYKEFILKNVVNYNPSEGKYNIDSDIAFADGWEDEVIDTVNEIKREVGK